MVAKILLFVLIFLQFRCLSTKDYLKHRSRDFTDMLTVGLESESFGVSFWFWCVGGGIAGNLNSKGIGLRGGTIGYYETGAKRNINLFSSNEMRSSSNTMGNSMILQNSLEHRPAYDGNERNKSKSFEALNLLMIFPIPSHKTPEYVSGGCDAPLYTEFSFGFFYGVRVGFNFYENLDFLTGLASIDIAKDDIE